MAEAKLVENDIIERAQGEAAKLIAEADAYYDKTIASAQREVAPLIAQAVTAEGDAEKKLQKTFAQRREHEQIMGQVASVEALSKNRNTVIFGQQNNNLLAQLETFNMCRK